MLGVNKVPEGLKEEGGLRGGWRGQLNEQFSGFCSRTWCEYDMITIGAAGEGTRINISGYFSRTNGVI